MKRVAAKIVPKLLNFEQKQCRMDIAEEMLTTCNNIPHLLKKIVTGNASWVYSYGYDIETKAQSSHPEEPKAKKARQVRSNVNFLLTVFFDCNGSLS